MAGADRRPEHRRPDDRAGDLVRDARLIGATRLSGGIAFASQWLAQLPLSWLVAVPLGFGLLGLAPARCRLSVVIAEAAVTALVWLGASWLDRASDAVDDG